MERARTYRIVFSILSLFGCFSTVGVVAVQPLAVCLLVVVQYQVARFIPNKQGAIPGAHSRVRSTGGFLHPFHFRKCATSQEITMTVDQTTSQLKIDIWDLLFRSGPMTVEQIAVQLNCPALSIEDAVRDAWFVSKSGVIHIA